MTVRDTVHEAMKANGLTGYEDRALPVIRALEAREEEIVQSLVSFAVDKGLDRESALRGIADSGMFVQMRAAEDPRVAAMERQIEEMQATLRDLRG